jgi:hypothetical protein
MVMDPVVTTFEITLPLNEPKRALDITATLAVPPLLEPRRAPDRLRKNCPPPEACSATPKMIKPINMIPKTFMGIPKRLVILRAWKLAVVAKERVYPSINPGI